MAGSIGKPQLRGLLAGQLVKDFSIASALGLLSGVGYYALIKAPRRRKYEEFYKTYDAEKDFIRMRDAGVFQSVRPGGEVGEGW